MMYDLFVLNPVVSDIEQLGTKEKFWFIDANDVKDPEKLDELGDAPRTLFKFSKGKTGEHWSEKCAAELCHLLGIPHAHYDLAQIDGRFGIISRNIIPQDFRMVMGNEVLHSKTSDYPCPLLEDEKAVRIREHTVTRVLGCLDRESIKPPPSKYSLIGLNAADVFCGYLMLDALISNQDRHHENWAIMLNNETGEQFLCPTYDHAASLGRELDDKERDDRMTTNDKNR